MEALPERYEVVDCLGQISKTVDRIIGGNGLIRRILLIGRDENGFDPHLLGTEDIGISRCPERGPVPVVPATHQAPFETAGHLACDIHSLQRQ